jgi:hypothetical protein
MVNFCAVVVVVPEQILLGSIWRTLYKDLWRQCMGLLLRVDLILTVKWAKTPIKIWTSLKMHESRRKLTIKL